MPELDFVQHLELLTPAQCLRKLAHRVQQGQRKLPRVQVLTAGQSLSGIPVKVERVDNQEYLALYQTGLYSQRDEAMTLILLADVKTCTLLNWQDHGDLLCPTFLPESAKAKQHIKKAPAPGALEPPEFEHFELELKMELQRPCAS